MPEKKTKRRPAAKKQAAGLEVFEGVGHLPQLETPERFIAVLERFIAENEPARFDSEQWRGRLRVVASKP